MDTIAIILAAGQGTRMKSQTPKVLHTLMDKPLVRYSVEMAIRSHRQQTNRSDRAWCRDAGKRTWQ